MVNTNCQPFIKFMAVLILASSAVWAPASWAADPVVNARSIADSKPGDQKAKPNTGTTNDQIQQRAMSLVDSHLPELQKLLARLKTDNPRQYELAIRDLAKSARRLESAKSRDEELYRIEVELLKTQSNVKIQTARLKVRDSETGREALRKAADRLLKAEVARAKYNVKVFADRVERARQQHATANSRLETLQDNLDTELNKKYTSLLRNAGRKISSEPSNDSKTKSTRRKRQVRSEPEE